MLEYDYIIKVVLTGDEEEGKVYLATTFCESFYNIECKNTLGLDFHVKTLSVLGKSLKFQLWELLSKGRFKSHFPSYYGGALGAIIIIDITKPDFQDELSDIVQMITEQSGDIPMLLLTYNSHGKEFQAVLGLETMLTAYNYNNNSFTEIDLIDIPDPEIIFTKLAEHVIKRLEISPHPRPVKRQRSIRPEFTVNKSLKLRLEQSRTNIYVGGRLFKQCKFLLLDIPVAHIANYDEIESIDEAAEKLNRSLEMGRQSRYHISPDIEFWGHCSNLQVWYENEYDTRILHSNLAFPLLKALEKAGDLIARKVFKEEIALRLASGYPSVVQYLINEKYLNYLNKEEIDSLLEDANFIKNINKWYVDVKDIPKWLSKKIKGKLKYISVL